MLTSNNRDITAALKDLFTDEPQYRDRTIELVLRLKIAAPWLATTRDGSFAAIPENLNPERGSRILHVERRLITGQALVSLYIARRSTDWDEPMNRPPISYSISFALPAVPPPQYWPNYPLGQEAVDAHLLSLGFILLGPEHAEQMTTILVREPLAERIKAQP